jgi:hypothetical protein
MASETVVNLLGEPIHPAFRTIAGKCRGMHTWVCDPGRTLSAHASISAMRFRKNADDPRCVTEPASHYPDGSEVSVTATPGTCYTFGNWTGSATGSLSWERMAETSR